MAAEPAAYADKTSPERMHINKLRLIGDGLAWKLLHGYAIRQLAREMMPPPSLSHQAAGFTATMQIAEDLAREDLPVLVADLTNCICSGDILVCADPERPVIIESGGHPAFIGRGRKGRQLRRNAAISELLERGYGAMPGLEADVVTVTLDVDPRYVFDAVAEVTELALANGTAVIAPTPNQVIWATAEKDSVGIPDECRAVCETFGQALAFGVHLRTLVDPDPRIVPVVSWPIPISSRLALFEGDVVVTHLVNLAAFCHSPKTELPRVVGHRSNRSGEVVAFLLEGAGGSKHELSPAFLVDVLYGFQEVETVRETMRTFAIASERAAEEAPEIDRAATKIAFIESIDELRALSQDVERRSQFGVIQMPMRVNNELSELATRRGRKLAPPRVIIRCNAPKNADDG